MKLIKFIHPALIGKECFVAETFIPSITRLCDYAVACGVLLHVNSSYRGNTNVKGAIVKPANHGCHLIAHAIDANFVLNGVLITSDELTKCIENNTLPTEIVKFLALVKKDAVLRWGGDFKTPDVIHFDDNMYLRDSNKWNEIYVALRTPNENNNIS